MATDADGVRAALMHRQEHIEQASRALKAMAHPLRLRILCVLGNQVIVSCSPNVFVFTDDNGDDVPDKKELLFTKTGQPQHDHSAHAFLFGPDGKLYWNFGNTGGSVHDKNGKIVIDKAGNQVVDNGRPYWGGMAFRCDMDGNVWASAGWAGAGYDGVRVIAPDGTAIGQIDLPEICSNLCFGGKYRNRLFMAASQSLYAVYVHAQGVPCS